jgi:hypothetical protein
MQLLHGVLILSSWRLSINACFCCSVILIFLRAGLPVGVTAPAGWSSTSSDFLLRVIAGAILFTGLVGCFEL